MTRTDLHAGETWERAARRLATSVNRRARVAAFARSVGLALLVAGVLALAWRAVGPAVPGLGARTGVLLLVAAGLVAGLLAGRRASKRVRAVSAGDAAWALDRLAEAGGRGLTAAVARGPAASEAAWAGVPLPSPPAVRLLPPGGLVSAVAAVLLAALALLVAERRPEPVAPPRPDTAAADLGGRAGAGPDGARGAAARGRDAESRAEALDHRAEEARRVRAALNLPTEGPLEPREVAACLQDPERRRAARRAASDGTALSQLLGSEEATEEDLARLLEQGELDRAEASRSRRQAVGARAHAGVLPVPPGRRAVVTQYLRLID